MSAQESSSRGSAWSTVPHFLQHDGRISLGLLCARTKTVFVASPPPELRVHMPRGAHRTLAEESEAVGSLRC